jgi:predicted nucleic acid-binding protein
MIVVDASVVVSGLDRDGPARRLLIEGGPQVPHVADLEVAQALRGQVLRGRMEPTDAWDRLLRYVRLGVRRHPATGLLPRVWSLRGNLTAYDASYVALAEALGCPLATADGRLAQAPGIDCEVILVAG